MIPEHRERCAHTAAASLNVETCDDIGTALEYDPQAADGTGFPAEGGNKHFGELHVC